MQKPGGPFVAPSLIWTLNLGSIAIYAVAPDGAFASEGYLRLHKFLKAQFTEGAERISVPGVISGKVRLLNGTVVPVIVPVVRGVFCWSTRSLVESIAGPKPPEAAPDQEKELHAARQEGVIRFLDRVYFEHRNLGISAPDRAVNYAGTNAFSATNVYESAIREEMELDTIEVERSPVCRPDSDCWDVKLHFFYPQRQVQTVRKVYRFTIDVSDVIPLTVGPVRSWFVR
jgi:cyanobactin maturation PatA/PatG family protease